MLMAFTNKSAHTLAIKNKTKESEHLAKKYCNTVAPIRQTISDIPIRNWMYSAYSFDLMVTWIRTQNTNATPDQGILIAH
jgi:hypothetical protein